MFLPSSGSGRSPKRFACVKNSKPMVALEPPNKFPLKRQADDSAIIPPTSGVEVAHETSLAASLDGFFAAISGRVVVSDARRFRFTGFFGRDRTGLVRRCHGNRRFAGSCGQFFSRPALDLCRRARLHSGTSAALYRGLRSEPRTK